MRSIATDSSPTRRRRGSGVSSICSWSRSPDWSEARARRRRVPTAQTWADLHTCACPPPPPRLYPLTHPFLGVWSFLLSSETLVLDRIMSAAVASSSASTNAQDPSGWGGNFWVTLADPQTGNEFYACPATGETSWEPPEGHFVCVWL